MKVLLIDTNHSHLKSGLEELGIICDEDYTSSKEKIEEKIQMYDGIVIRSRFHIDKCFLDKATNLKFIARVGAGLENIDVDHAKNKNITLIAAPEGNRNAVGEHAIAMILSLFNKLKKGDNEIRHGEWLREDNRGIELEGKTVGIIGYGNTGKAFAKKLMGFDVNVICYDIIENIGDENAKQVSLDEIFESTEVLSLHIPQTVLTNKMVDQSFINKFKNPFYLINTARGSAVIIKDLMKAIDQYKILGACLDVLEFEKSSFENFFEAGNELRGEFRDLIQSDKVLLSPHVAGWTVESKFKLADTIVKKVDQLIDQHKSIK
jgi:D-3-phosphoglycerate dehydrogenase